MMMMTSHKACQNGIVIHDDRVHDMYRVAQKSALDADLTNVELTRLSIYRSIEMNAPPKRRHSGVEWVG
jgi:hypothetical protein